MFDPSGHNLVGIRFRREKDNHVTLVLDSIGHRPALKLGATIGLGQDRPVYHFRLRLPLVLLNATASIED